MTEGSAGADGVAAGQPRGIWDILSEAFDLYKKNAVLLIITAAVAMGPVYAIKDAFMAVALPPHPPAGLERGEQQLQERDREMPNAPAPPPAPPGLPSPAPPHKPRPRPSPPSGR